MTSKSVPLRIGLSANVYQPDFARMAYKGRRLLFMEEGMFHWVMAEGAVAFLIPTSPSNASVDDIVSMLDGIIMTGGVDMAPQSYGEEPLRPEWSGDKHRDEYEVTLVREAMRQEKPLLGVCRGHQVINVALGGTLFQDIRTQNPTALHHRIFDVYEDNHHQVRLESGGMLARVFGGNVGTINSVHHQAVKDVAPTLTVDARSPEDGIVEGLRLKDKSGPWVLGVQWHPELQNPADKVLLSPSPILKEFLAAARKRRAG